MTHNRKISVVGLGYVGLPVAVAFGQQQTTIGFDIHQERISELQQGEDRTGEVTSVELEEADIIYTTDSEVLAQADFHIVAVPTPVDEAHQPDLTALIHASETVAQGLKAGDIVVYESTVYPGVTEDVCVPILEGISGLQCGKEFSVGYSPERINPGDKSHTFSKICKVVAGFDRVTLEIVAAVYESVVTAGVFKASSIKVAEAAKVIENTQRDLNIALMNELAILFERMQIDTQEVLKAARTKWNFVDFRPGLVGGHCIGVDPYYLTYQAEKLGYIPQVILAGRRINDSMGRFIAQRTIKEMIHAGVSMQQSKVIVLGLTFKENCPDLRNSRVIDIIDELQAFGVEVIVSDPLADPDEAWQEYGVKLTDFSALPPCDAVVMAVAHQSYADLSAQTIKNMARGKPVLIDVKGATDKAKMLAAGIHFWRL
jgi:UDP-N-acetyl-D-galactosamine dehydrogenase